MLVAMVKIWQMGVGMLDRGMMMPVVAPLVRKN
jgi:hypothetical protein